MEKELISEIKRLEKRAKSKDYNPESYYNLDNPTRKRLLEDFEKVGFVLHNSQKFEEKRYAGGSGDFYPAFSTFWLSYYLSQKYVEILKSNSIIDTYLNDPVKKKRGRLSDLREQISKPSNVIRLRKLKRKALKINCEKCRDLMSRYPIKREYSFINLRKLLKYRLLYVWLPAQYFLASILPEKKWWWKKDFLIKDEHLSDLEIYLEKGDILLQRANFYLTNATLPGFWTHVMLYDGEGKIIEAVPYKLREKSWREASRSDYLCVLRPKCSKIEKDRAVEYARKQIGKPYDLNFDFLSDESMVCSELVLKSYPYLRPRLENIIGRLTFPPSNFIDLMNEGKLEFVYFLDSTLKKKKIILGTEKELSISHLRSKWDLLQK